MDEALPPELSEVIGRFKTVATAGANGDGEPGAAPEGTWDPQLVVNVLPRFHHLLRTAPSQMLGGARVACAPALCWIKVPELALDLRLLGIWQVLDVTSWLFV